MILFLLAFVAFLIIGIPISVSIGFSAVLGCLSLGYPLVVIGQKMVSGIDSWLLIAIPLFILAGNLMNAGKITDVLFGSAGELGGWIPGGLGHANVLASVIFAGMSGSASADAGGLGAIEIKAMRDHGYDDDFSAAVTAASSVIGPIFPPSIPLIIYGASASVSVSKLFMGGVIPALVMAVLMMVLIYIYAVKRGYERTAFNLRNLARQFVHALPACITPVIILAGFTLGWFTPTEASAVATIYALIISVLVYKSMDLKTFLQCLKESAISSANTLFIIGTSTLFTYVMAKEGISALIANTITGVSSRPAVVMFIIDVILLILGVVVGPGAGRRYPDPDAARAAAHRQHHRLHSGVLRRCGGAEPDDRSGHSSLRRVSVCHFGREQDQAGAHLQSDPALPGSAVDHAGCHLYLSAGRYLPAGYAAGCNGCVKTYIFKSD